MQDRLQHLENLVLSLSQKKGPSESVIDFNTSSSDATSYVTPPSVGDRETKSSPTDTGTLVVKDEGISYIDSADWRAVLEEVSTDDIGLLYTQELRLILIQLSRSTA